MVFFEPQRLQTYLPHLGSSNLGYCCQSCISVYFRLMITSSLERSINFRTPVDTFTSPKLEDFISLPSIHILYYKLSDNTRYLHIKITHSYRFRIFLGIKDSLYTLDIEKSNILPIFTEEKQSTGVSLFNNKNSTKLPPLYFYILIF